ncbi:phosphoenolpyruvate--protein phosphotransferase [Serinicoccus chungangensis]|uniref:phosphoenolpyruvate--protein phosphotransferase n=1 Tax=Serinicoccus chungangensis TaxID=767452 RepID=UPI00111B1AE7|nr:phosphoenolpyruvate--protein phosphotransferase [Serinicoccus chungangensis]
MIALVVVSHSRALARAAVALAAEMSPEDGPRLEVAAGLDEETTGTDAVAIAEALGRADDASDGAGVLVLVDLGSAVLSTEMALEMVDPEVAARVRVSPAPLVEGLVAATVAAGTGADLETCAAEARRGLDAKTSHLGDAPDPAEPGAGDETGDAASAEESGDWTAAEVSVTGEHGLHARPAARLVSTAAAASPGTRVRVRNVTTGAGPVDALSLSGVATLGARQGHVLRVEATGERAGEVLRQIEQLAATAFGDEPGPAQPLADDDAPAPSVSEEPGVAGSGLEAAMGPAVLDRTVPDPDDVVAGSEQEEQDRLDAAVAEALEALEQLSARARRHLGDGQAEVFEAHAALLRDPELLGDVAQRISGGEAAAFAWQDAVQDVVGRFEALPDAYLQERAQDVRSIGERVMRVLLDVAEPEALGEGVLVVDELDPALAISLDAGAIRGVVTRQGGALGHGVLIARARGLPVLTGAGARADVEAGTLIAFDARAGRLEIDPVPEVQTAFSQMLERRAAERQQALADTHLPVVTRDGARVTVKANVSSVATARLGAGLGAEGSGLVRTEAVFAQWHRAPTVDQQVEVYSAIAQAFDPHAVTIRTWDVGGDKPLDFIPIEEEANPFLGVRGIRAFRKDPSLLLDQLEALCRVARGQRLNVLFPMVTSLDDVDWARARLQEAARRVGLSAPPHQLGVGIMVEVPAVAVRLGRLAHGLDVISIGSNDLSQYTLAAERGNPHVATWSDGLDPAVLQLIRYICDRAPEGVVVSLCGELASDPDVAGLLVGLGVRELSASPSAVPTIKARLRAGSLREMQDLAASAVTARDAAAVRDLLALHA